MDHPQAFGALLRPDGARCVMGSAALAVGIPCAVTDFGTPLWEVSAFDREAAEAMWRVWPILKDWATCPGCGFQGDLGNIAAHLNDGHLWTREQIADWVQTIEPSETPTVSDDSQASDAVAREDAVGVTVHAR